MSIHPYYKLPHSFQVLLYMSTLQTSIHSQYKHSYSSTVQTYLFINCVNLCLHPQYKLKMSCGDATVLLFTHLQFHLFLLSEKEIF